MNPIALRTSENGYQIKTFTISPDGNPTSLRVEIRRLVRLDKWFISIFNASTGENILQYLPLIGSDPEHEMNDILAQFGYKGIGSLVVLPKVSELAGTDPNEENLGLFEICWGDHIGE